ncbi:MAG TPA: IS4 family transposase [Candidatus Sulfotelmatobacter sp.]|nr:IS4 family transposase [Candidatus Sulfotelmatobacter sp.]
MNAGRTIFAQLLDFVSPYEFRKCVDRYGGHYKVQRFSCWDQFLCLAFAQLTYRESLRDIQACLRVAQPKLYHMGFRGTVARNTLANANQVRDWRIFADFAQGLITTARTLYAADDFGVELDQVAYALDATVIDLCLALFPWAKFRRRKAALKLHTLLDLRGNIPSVLFITPGRVHDVNILDQLPIEAGAFYILDRGYLDFARLSRLHQARGFFVTRAKRNFRFRYLDSRPVDRMTGVHSDQTIRLYGFYSTQSYPERLRRVRYFDAERRKWLVFLTNNFTLPAVQIAQLYQCRWQVELFFKWIKQHLRIKAFYGTSENAVKTQIWTAIAVYVLVAIVKKRLRLAASLYTILQILSVSLFEKIPLGQALAVPPGVALEADLSNQLNLFD